MNEVWNGSIGLALEPSADIAQEVPLGLVGGLTVLEQRPELPQWFSEAAIENVQKLGRILADPGVTGLGLSAVADDGAQSEARVTPVVVQHASEAFQGTDEAMGSVAGVLDVVNLRKGRTVSLYDPEERHAVRCTYPAELLETVRAYLGSPVRATGAITRNRFGQIAAVKAESLEQVEDLGDVPNGRGVDRCSPLGHGRQGLGRVPAVDAWCLRHRASTSTPMSTSLGFEGTRGTSTPRESPHGRRAAPDRHRGKHPRLCRSLRAR